MCGQRGRKFNNVKAGMHRPIYYSRYAGGRSFVFEWGSGGRPWDTSSPLIRARYASYGRYLCRDDKFNRRLKMRLEIRETRFLAHTSFFFFPFPPPYREIYTLHDSLSPLLSRSPSRFDLPPLLFLPFLLPHQFHPRSQFIFFRNIDRVKYFPGYD